MNNCLILGYEGITHIRNKLFFVHHKITLYIRQVKQKHWNIRSVSGKAFSSHEAGRHFILNFRIYCWFHHDEAGIFKRFCFIWKFWIGWGRYQLLFLNLPTASSNHAGGAILSLYDSLQPSVFTIRYIYIKTCERLLSKHASCWNLSLTSLEAAQKKFY